MVSLQVLQTRLQLLLTAILMGLYLLIFLHLSALMNRLALSDLLMKSCSEYERSRQEKEAQVGWVIRQIQIGVVV